MKLITDSKPHKIIADEGKEIREKNDVYVPEHYDENDQLIPEHVPYYSTILYVPNSFTEEKMNRLYVEEDINMKEE